MSRLQSIVDGCGLLLTLTTKQTAALFLHADCLDSQEKEMKLTGILNLTLGAAAAASTIPARKIDTAPNPLTPSDPSPAFAKLGFSGERNCRARIMEKLNQSAVYSVIDVNEKVCSQWVTQVEKNCPDVQTALPAELFANTVRAPNNTLASNQDAYVRGWVSSEGGTNKTIADCTAAQFNQVTDDLKNAYVKSQVGLGLGVGFGTIGLMTAMGGVAYCVATKKSAKVAPDIELQ